MKTVIGAILFVILGSSSAFAKAVKVDCEVSQEWTTEDYGISDVFAEGVKLSTTRQPGGAIVSTGLITYDFGPNFNAKKLQFMVVHTRNRAEPAGLMALQIGLPSEQTLEVPGLEANRSGTLVIALKNKNGAIIKHGFTCAIVE